MATLVTWGINNGREAVNERLAEKYSLTLDNVQMIPGNSDLEREHYLRVKLIEFYQTHAPEKLIAPTGKARKDPEKNEFLLELFHDSSKSLRFSLFSWKLCLEQGTVFLEELNEKLYGVSDFRFYI